MNINQRRVALFLDEDGHTVLELANVPMSSAAGLAVYVQDTDDIGIWARIEREDGEHIVLIRWDYVLSVDFPAGETKTVGLKP
ncbi:MAG: hypothetical protein ACJ71U_09455 [Terriglobales bacterium]